MTTKRERLKLMFSHSEGLGARLENKPIEDNPYEKGTDDYLAWNAGWSRANYELKVASDARGDKETAK